MGQQTRVLTLDGSPSSRNDLLTTLSGRGFAVIQADNGQDGLDLLDRQTVDIVVSDIDLPQMDGFAFVRQLRENPRYADLPVLILTDKTSRALRTEGKVAGANGWMLKPADPERLADTLRRMSRTAP